LINKFKWCQFTECDLEDPFFDSLKRDYLEFPQWFQKKRAMGENAFVFKDDKRIKAFVYLKEEDEAIELLDGMMPKEKRLKIGTLKLSDDIQGQRLGEGAVGVALWHWQNLRASQVYITVFSKHAKLISMLEQFGFEFIGNNSRGEKIYTKDKRTLKYDTPYTSFPYINPMANRCGYIPINDDFHDSLFPYSELCNTKQETEEIAAANGRTKIFIATPSSILNYKQGEPVFIYRRHTGQGQATYKSVITSFCSIIRQVNIKLNNQELFNYNDFLNIIGNKTVYNEIELKNIYNKCNVVVLEMIYNGYFGKGKNITHRTLKENGCFEGYPYTTKLHKEQFKYILEMGGKSVQDIIID